MNLLVIFFVLLVLWRAYKGLRGGFAREVNSLVSLFMALIVLSAAFVLVAGIVEKNTKTIVVAVILLAGMSILYRLISLVMKSIETIAKLPVINLINMLLGMAAGALEVLVVFWILYVIIGNFPTGAFGEKIMEWTTQSTIMINVYNKNYIANWIASL